MSNNNNFSNVSITCFFTLLVTSTQLKFIENGSRMAKRIQYIKTNQMIEVNEIKETIKQTIKTVQ